MESLLDRKLLVISGKGGVGKTTMSAALGLLAAERGRRTTIVEFGEQSRLAALFGKEPADPGLETRLAPRLSSISIDPDRALLEWLQALGGRVSGRILASSGTFQYFAAAAPGAREIVSMVKVWQLAQGPRRGRPGADLVILDAPATGHALGMLRSPKTFGAIARVGPIVRQTRQVQALLSDPELTDYVAVALGTELAVTETIEFQEGLESAVGREPAVVLVNGLVPRRFNGAEMEQINGLLAADASRSGRANGAGAGVASAEVVFDAVAAAREAHEQARVQQSQLARLRRRGFHVIGVPFVWTPELELEGIRTLAHRLGRAAD